MKVYYERLFIFGDGIETQNVNMEAKLTTRQKISLATHKQTQALICFHVMTMLCYGINMSTEQNIESVYVNFPHK